MQRGGDIDLYIETDLQSSEAIHHEARHTGIQLNGNKTGEKE